MGLKSNQNAPVVAQGDNELLSLTTRIVSAYVERNQVPMQDVPGIVRSVHTALYEISGGGKSPDKANALKPAVSVKRSISQDYIVCLEDGVKLRMLKRYLRTHYDMSPEDYRKKWGLPHDYPMVAPSYAKMRSVFAKKIGLGKIPTKRRKKT